MYVYVCIYVYMKSTMVRANKKRHWYK